MGCNNEKCCGGNQLPNIKGNTSFVILILFILMAIVVGGRFF